MIDGQKEEIGVEESRIEKAPSWMVSLGDVVALMLAFFVMLYAMSNPQSEKFEEVIALIATRVNPDEKPNPTSELNIGTVDLVGGLSPEYLNRILEDKLSRDEVLSQAHIVEISKRVIISLPADAIFKTGSSEIEEGASESIRRLAGVISQFGNQVDIAGHSDPDPVSTDKYPSKWDLSLARALSLATALNENGYAGDFTVLGMADSRYRFLDKRLSEEKRYELARRVDIVIQPIAGGQP